MTEATPEPTTVAVPAPLTHRQRLRKFAREVGGIVLGVLIALGLGEIASDIRMRGNVANARAAIRVELGKTVGQGIERVRIAGCVDRKLDALARVVADADRTGRLPPLGAIGAPPIWAWTSAVWDRAISAETLAHFETGDWFGLPGAFELVPTMRQYNQREYEIWSGFNVLVGPGRGVAPEEIARLRRDIVEARNINASLAAIAKTLKHLSELRGVAYDMAEATHYAGRTNARSPICQPIGTNVPAIYGLTPPRATIMQ